MHLLWFLKTPYFGNITGTCGFDLVLFATISLTLIPSGDLVTIQDGVFLQILKLYCPFIMSVIIYNIENTYLLENVIPKVWKRAFLASIIKSRVDNGQNSF